VSRVELLTYVNRLLRKYQEPFGIAIWGFTAEREAKEVKVDEEGRLVVSGDVTATVEFPDWQRTSTKTTDELYTQLSNIYGQLDITLSALRDAITAPSPNDKTLADLYERLDSIRSQLDVVLSSRASESTVSSILSQLDIALSELRDALTTSTIDTTMYTKTLADVWERLDSIRSQLDVALSTRASETTLSGIKSQTDKLTFDASSYLYVNAAVVSNPPNLDVALSTRASESTLSSVKTLLDKLEDALASVGTDKIRIDDAGGSITVDGTVNVGNFPSDFPDSGTQSRLDDLKGALASVATDKLRTSVVDALPESPFNITKVAGTALTGRDWSNDFAKLQNLNKDLLSLYRQLLLFGVGEDDWHQYGERTIHSDTTEVTVTETSWTEKKRYDFGYRFRAAPYFRLWVYCKFKSDGTNTLYVRARVLQTGKVIWETSTTSADYVSKGNWFEFYWGRDGVYGPTIVIEAYITGGTGYIGQFDVCLWSPFLVYPFKVDDSGYALVRIVGCL